VYVFPPLILLPPTITNILPPTLPTFQSPESPQHHQRDNSKSHTDVDIATKSYFELHRPASEFDSRAAYLNHELQIMKPRRYEWNLPHRDFRFEREDVISAVAGLRHSDVSRYDANTNDVVNKEGWL
jgi:hypothetical protein